MITTYEHYSRLTDLGLTVDRGKVEGGYMCYDRLDTHETNHYSISERDEDLAAVRAIFAEEGKNE